MRPSRWVIAAAVLVAALPLACRYEAPDAAEQQRLWAAEYARLAGTTSTGISAALLDVELRAQVLPRLVADERFRHLHAPLRRILEWIARQDLEAPETDLLLVTGDRPQAARLVRVTMDYRRRHILAIGDSLRLDPQRARSLSTLQETLRARRSTAYREVSFEVLRGAAGHPETLANLRRLVRADRDEARVELGGFALVRRDAGGAPFLAFEVVPSRFAATMDRMRAVEGDLEASIALVVDHPELFDLPELQTKVVRRELGKPFADEVKRRRLELFFEQARDLIRHAYELDWTLAYGHMLDGPTAGRYVGVFHVHPPDNPPSWQDKQTSFGQRHLVVVPRSTPPGYDIYDLFHTPPDAPPRRVLHIGDPGGRGGAAPGTASSAKEGSEG